jgi:hypothetical protein
MVSGCKEAYHPAVKNANTNYLVVEGNIVAGNDSTFIHLSRTVAVSDTNKVQPETNAAVQVESDDGEIYQLQNEHNGIYDAPPMNISLNKNYRLHIFTADGKEYASDYVPVKQTPEIDSVSWKFNETNGIDISVNTHDATNNTRYYRWQYTETWEHRAIDSSELIYTNGALRFRLPSEQIYRCWNIVTSGEIFIASTVALSSDVVFEKKLIDIPYESGKVRWYYSVLVTQYALTKEAFEYWENLKKNTEQIGSIFDPQPFAEYGNMHCLTDTTEPVVGFISSCSTSKQRLYIEYAQVHYPYTLPECAAVAASPNDIDRIFSQTYLYQPLRYGANGSVIGNTTECLDCLLQGGTNIKPPYMPR